MSTSWSRSIISQSRATLTAVSMLSPVTMTARTSALRKVRMTAVVSGLSRFSMTRSPTKVRPHSSSSRGSRCTLARPAVRGRWARASTRWPCCVYHVNVAPKSGGTDSGLERDAMVSGAPLQNTSK
uniref:Uncharacterized protein n=1 Tax=Ixodes ricinus TaxID=34613 RepID=A0A6B0UPJ2_IXORI